MQGNRLTMFLREMSPYQCNVYWRALTDVTGAISWPQAMHQASQETKETTAEFVLNECPLERPGNA